MSNPLELAGVHMCPLKDLSDLETVPVDSRDQVAHRRGVIAALYEDGLPSLLSLLRCVPMFSPMLKGSYSLQLLETTSWDTYLYLCLACTCMYDM